MSWAWGRPIKGDTPARGAGGRRAPRVVAVAPEGARRVGGLLWSVSFGSGPRSHVDGDADARAPRGGPARLDTDVATTENPEDRAGCSARACEGATEAYEDRARCCHGRLSCWQINGTVRPGVTYYKLNRTQTPSLAAETATPSWTLKAESSSSFSRSLMARRSGSVRITKPKPAR